MVLTHNDTFIQNDKYGQYFNYFSKFKLSNFQKWAIKSIVDKDHILVTAHTGSGKTLPAEFAIQYFVNQGKKVIYTAPIKALSNTKLFDLRNKYPHISFGIITGDVTDNPDAEVLIMTTEILSHTLYNLKLKNKTNNNFKLNFEMDIQNELAAVIFDEVHYINDPERGNVWEQAILLLPPHIQLIMLSATIDKAELFAKWIEDEKSEQSKNINVKPKNVYLTSTEHRVVPLTHYMWLTCHKSTLKKSKNTEYEHLLNTFSNKEIVVNDEHNNFKNHNYETMVKICKYFNFSNTPRTSRQFILNSLILYLKKNNNLPAICFVFSRKQVERAANEINFTLFDDDDLTPSIIEDECKKILMNKLTNYKEYIQLPEFENIIQLLKKGIGYHHAGVLSVYREMIEILFDRKLIKLLFATETLAVGVNFSTTSVIFTGVTKYDGNNIRLLAPHEYTQIAGRAGRRGIDKVGKIWLCCNLFELPGIHDFKNMLSGKPQTLVSKFKISFPLCLNNIASVDNYSNNIINFANKSLINSDINKEVNFYNETINKYTLLIEDKRKLTLNNKTNREFINNYISMKSKILVTNNKSKKKLHKEIKNLEEKYINIIEESKIFEIIQQYEIEINKNVSYKNNALTYLETKTNNTINLLLNSNFIDIVDDNLQLCEQGKISCFFNETHPLVISNILYNTNYFNDFSTIEIAGILSVFTNINVDDSVRTIAPNTNSKLINITTSEIDKLLNKYYDLEQDYKINSGSCYERNFDIQQYIVDWCKTETEIECKQIIYSLNTEKNIFIGDFVKAILKINNIANEIERVAECINNMGLLEKIKDVQNKTLKYIATNQSLYI
tara:strand:- start:1949 stop:4468 length:2520 start_codon:yes stop_codon:yes gene_type:complete